MQGLIDQGLAHHRAGKLAEAEIVYGRVLQSQPDNATALHLMGVLALQTGRFDNALDWIGRAIAHQPHFPEALNNQGNALKALNRLEDATEAYDRALAQRPDFPEALNNRGFCLLTLGRLDEAAQSLARATALRPDYPEARINSAMALERLGRFAEAAEHYGAAIRLLPANADLHNALGNALRAAGYVAKAAESYGEAARLRPDFVEFWINQGVALTDCRHLDEAITVLQLALSLAPDHVRALIAFGVALSLKGDFAQAAHSLGRAAELAPDFPPAHTNLGLALIRLGRLEEAAECQRKALRLQPDYVVALNNLAITLTEMGQPDQAVINAEAAIGLRPDFAEAHISRGTALKALEKFDAAADSLETALRLKPNSAEAHTALGSVYQSLWRLDEAAAEHREALHLWPDYPAALHNLGSTLLLLGRASEAVACYEQVAAKAPMDATTISYLVYSAMYRDDLDNDGLAAIYRRYGEALARNATPIPKPGPQAANRRLKIGYLSSDLRNHPVASNLLPVVRHHDHSAFEIHYYSHGTTSDEYTADLKASADGWHDITRLNDTQAAELIRADGMDILVSLAGRFDLNRPGICAFRAAPIQISMHDVATSGLTEMDYIIGDGRLLARPSTEYFTERRLRLPSFYIADFPDYLPPLPPAPRQGPVVFGCFNNPVKISPTLIPLWGAILAALPESRLVLKYYQAYDSSDLRHRLTQTVTQAGAQADQLVFIGSKESYTGFVGRYNQVDIALDTWPFSGSTTSFQALSMGVPVVTLATDRMVSRWTASMLRSLRLDPLITTQPEDYVATAIETAGNVESWRGRRHDIRDRLARSSLCNGALWAKRLERLYRAVWRRHCQG